MKITEEFSEKVLQLWDGWELRVMVCLSLMLQITLVMLGSRRKYVARSWIRFLVWSAYVLADLIAPTTLGILARKQGNSDTCSEKLNHSIQAFWAPFLLLHLGGPDTITAYSIQDNELWLRHLLGLVSQVIFALYVFVMAWNGTTLTFLSIPMFITGITNYGQRIWSMKSSTKLSHHTKDILLTNRPQWDSESTKVVPREDVRSVKHPLHQAYYLFRMSIFHFEDFDLGPSELNDSYSLISGKSSEEAFELVEMELGFIYDNLYTKATTTFTGIGILLRLFSFICSITTLVSFFMFVDKQPYSIIDVDITYLLLWGAIILEVYAFLCLFFSDWTMVWHFISPYQERPKSNTVYDRHEHFTKGKRWCRSTAQFLWTMVWHFIVPSQEQPRSKTIYEIHEHFTKVKRWCGSTGQFSLIHSCLKIKKCPKFLEKMMKHEYTEWRAPSSEMKEMIFHQLLMKGEFVIKRPEDADLRKLVGQRGDGVLDRMQQPADERLAAIRSYMELEFNHSLLIWHIATDLCYNAEHQIAKDEGYCKTSKQLSDYMMYLLVMRPSMLPKVRLGRNKETRYRDVCKKVRTFFREMKTKSSDEKNVCVALLGLMKDSYRVTVTINNEENLRTNELADGCKLAKKLQEFDVKEKWEMISNIWIEMLGYAAINCEWKEHAEGLGRGGELLTHVCVLMTHLGLNLQYQTSNEIEITAMAESSPPSQ